MSRFVRTFKARKIFLDELAVGSSISFAARAAGGTPSNFKRWRESDEAFAADWDEAIEEGTDYIEDEAVKRAIKKSDPLMLAILKARRPEKYDRGSKLELSGGIDVTGSRAKLLNKLARLTASGDVSSSGDQEESEVLETKAPPETKLLPAPSHSSIPERGRKRRGTKSGDRREEAA